MTDLTGAFQALFRLFMFIHIITTVLLTFTGSGAHAASLSSVTSKSRHRSKPRNTRNTQDGGDGGVTKGEHYYNLQIVTAVGKLDIESWHRN